MQVGERLRQYRKAKSFSIYKLSMKTDISQNHISAIENGKRQPTIETLQKLIKPLGITLAELFNDDENVVSYLTPKEKELIENFRNMSEGDSELFLKLSASLKSK